MVYVAITPIGLFGSDKEKVEKFSDINYRKLFKEDEIVDKLYLMRTNPRKLLDEIKDWGEVKFEFFSGPNSVGNYLREHLFEIGKELKYFTDYEDFKRKMNYWNLELTKRLIKSYAQQKDKIIIQVAEAISDLDKVLNLLSERLREWYSLYFPELNSIQKHETYVKLITTLKK
ncbi:C/D box methylation guide ribonucleoprotein complex aNOP56 subunit, partial [Methanocaldococcus villosus KIN24-T80]